MKYYPMFMSLAGRACLVVGAGAVAARKARALLECGARVTVVGERPVASFAGLARRGVALEPRRFRAADVAGRALVVAATDDRAVNAAVSAAARRRGVPVNAVDDPPNCDFIVPAVVRRGDLVVAVSTGGKSPAVARLAKERIAALLGDEYAALVKLLGAHRDRVKESVPGQGCRARVWKRIIEEGALEALRAGDPASARRTVSRCLSDASESTTGSGTGSGKSAGRRGGAKGRPPARAAVAASTRGGPQRQDPAARTGRGSNVAKRR